MLKTLNDEKNEIHLSVASSWELAIKTKTTRLTLALTAEDFVNDVVSRYDLRILDVNLMHSLRAGELELHHKDPFDRMLIAQAEIEKLAIVTPDPAFAPYGVELLW